MQAVSFGLIDGGVVDNQGLYSLGLEDSLRPPKYNAASEPSPNGKPEPRPFDLLIACDVASYFLDPYEVPSEPTKWYLKIPLKWIVVALALIVPLTGVTVGIFAANREGLVLFPAAFATSVFGIDRIWILESCEGLAKGKETSAWQGPRTAPRQAPQYAAFQSCRTRRGARAIVCATRFGSLFKADSAIAPGQNLPQSQSFLAFDFQFHLRIGRGAS